MKPRFLNRLEAAHQLAEQLAGYAGRPRLLVIGIARGGMVIAQEIARRLAVPLDVLVVRKLGVPCQEEVAMGAIAPGGVCVLNDELIDAFDIERDAIGVVRLREEREMERREQLYRGRRAARSVAGRTVILVDDGVATGATMRAAVLFLHQNDAARVIVAAPVIARDALRQLRAMAGEVVTLVVPEKMRSIGAWFEDFSAVSDAEVCRWLRPQDEPADRAHAPALAGAIPCDHPVRS